MAYFLTLCASYPMGDDTPIWLYGLIGVAALVLMIVSTVMSRKSKK